MLALKPESPVPLHHQLEQALKTQLAGGRWRPGQMIASERELMRAARVSRTTVRQALASLAAEGLLERVQGRGTFVASPRFEQEMRAVYSFSEQIRHLGLQIDDLLLQRRIVKAPDDLACLLGLRMGDKLIHVQRLRKIEGIPFALDNSYLPYALCPDLLDVEIGASLYRLLAEGYGLPPLRSTDVLEPCTADRATAHQLGIAVGAPLMFIERIAYTRDDVPLQVGRNHVRGDMCRFRVNLWSDLTSIEIKQLKRTADT